MKELNSYIDYFQQRNAIIVLRALHHLENPHWSLVKKYAIEKLGTPSLADLSYRKSCKQLVNLELAEAVERDSLKRHYYLTESEHEIAEVIEKAFVRIEKWRVRVGKNRRSKKARVQLPPTPPRTHHIQQIREA